MSRPPLRKVSMNDKPVIIIDNYDSFVYNLAQYVGEMGFTPLVFRNDRITLKRIAEIAPGHLIISPGPGTPDDAGISNAVIRRFAGKIPIMGVCLGHQCIGQVFGGRITAAAQPTHGKSSPVSHDGRTIFAGLHSPIEGGRYHSLVIDPDSLPDCIEVSATADGVIMGIRHRRFVIEGVQFHPESIMTGAGHDIIRNFLSLREAVQSEVLSCSN
ncbi:aminodeoxychorismate/anthranilate synthase component II [Dehalogenimonas sp. THU2]|uniref:anthranilate synthase component II n=1 Tax=Dehalogenimonas sp. THU2 TaxID=3151121 RepID=UPI0032182D8B